MLLTTQGALGNIVINRLAAAFPGLTVIREQPETKASILKRRARRLGRLTAASQAAAGICVRLAARRQRARVTAICDSHGLDRSPPCTVRIVEVASVNAPDCHAELARLAPGVVAVYGTRLLSRATLSACDAPFVNYHAGITPEYRGQHPGYWALANGEPERAGVTVHLVDAGVDTGAVVAQRAVALSSAVDSIASYQYVQMAHGLPLLVDAVAAALTGTLTARDLSTDVSRTTPLHYPPTLMQYIRNGLGRGVW